MNQSSTSGHIKAENVSLPTQALTLALTFRPQGNTDAGLFSYAVPSNANEFAIFDNSSQVYLTIGGTTYSTGYSFSDAEWHDLVVTWDGSSGQVQLFDNGALVYSGAQNSGSTLDGNGVIVFGQDQDSYGGGFQSNQAFHGDLSEFAVWDSVLTTTEITWSDTANAVISMNLVKALERSYRFCVW